MNSEIESLTLIRDMDSGDFNLVKSAFLKGLYYGDSWFSFMPKSIFMDNYKNIADALILSQKNKVRVVALKDEPSVILGYAILSKDDKTVHWVFVKKSWRGQGIARALLPSSIEAATHLSTVGRQLMSKLPLCVFNPFAV